MNKILLSTLLLISVSTTNLYAEAKFVSKNTSIKDIISTKSENINKAYKKNADLFTTIEKTEDDLKFENKLIEGFKNNYIGLKDTYETKEYNNLMNSYFVDALKTGNNRLADLILYDSGAVIDVNFKKTERPRITPLTAVATAIGKDGGDIEYFIKLIEMGANPNELTMGYDIPLMSLAATVDNYKIVFYLAMLGQNIMHVDGLDYYPLDYAVRNDSYRSIIIIGNLINEYKKTLTYLEKEKKE